MSVILKIHIELLSIAISI